jgi:hypothetical protein
MDRVHERTERRFVKRKGGMIKTKTKKVALVSIGTLFVLIVLALIAGPFVFPLNTDPDDIHYVVTYSTAYSEELGFDPVTGYETMAKDLGFDLARIPVYWNRIEAEEGEFDWNEMDAIMKISSQNDVGVIMAIGRRVPRWPECFIPDWVDEEDEEMLEASQLKMVTEVVERYKDHPALVRWQVENEPYFTLFGECPKLRKDFLFEEFDLVRELDDNTPLQTTASGEQSLWYPASRLAKDFVGVSVYRTTYNKVTGHTTYSIKPWMYRARAGLVGDATLIVSELQTEPWFARPISSYTIQEQIDIFGPEEFEDHIKYVEEIGFQEVLLWGTEWWYLMKEMDHPEIWEMAKELF